MTTGRSAPERDPLTDLYEACGHVVDQLRQLARQLGDAQNQLATVPTDKMRVDKLGPAAIATDLVNIASDNLRRGQWELQRADRGLSAAWSAVGRLYIDSEYQRSGATRPT